MDSDSVMLRRGLILFVALLCSAMAPQPSGQNLQVIPLPKDGEVLVSFKLDDTLTDEIRAAINSGLTLKFIYKVDLRRSSAVWVDRTIKSAVVMASLRYNTLTREYYLSRAIDGRIQVSDTTLKEEVAWNWLTRDFDRMSLFRGVQLETNADYYVRVSANASPRSSGFVWPWQGDDAMGFAKFTFIR